MYPPSIFRGRPLSTAAKSDFVPRGTHGGIREALRSRYDISEELFSAVQWQPEGNKVIGKRLVLTLSLFFTSRNEREQSFHTRQHRLDNGSATALFHFPRASRRNTTSSAILKSHDTVSGHSTKGYAESRSPVLGRSTSNLASSGPHNTVSSQGSKYRAEKSQVRDTPYYIPTSSESHNTVSSHNLNAQAKIEPHFNKTRTAASAIPLYRHAAPTHESSQKAQTLSNHTRTMDFAAPRHGSHVPSHELPQKLYTTVPFHNTRIRDPAPPECHHTISRHEPSEKGEATHQSMYHSHSRPKGQAAPKIKTKASSTGVNFTSHSPLQRLEITFQNWSLRG